VNDKIYGLAMVPNRSTPKRYIRLVSYVRQTMVDDDGSRVDVLIPYLYEKYGDAAATAQKIPYSKIRGYPADPELVQQWAEHARLEARAADQRRS
jgi:hypothetical protein